LFNFELIQFGGVDREQKEELVTPSSNSPSSLKQGGGKKADHTKRVCGVATKGSNVSKKERAPGIYLSIRTREGALREISEQPCMHSPSILFFFFLKILFI